MNVTEVIASVSNVTLDGPGAAPAAEAAAGILEAVGRAAWDALKRNARTVVDIIVLVSAMELGFYLYTRASRRRPSSGTSRPTERFADVAGLNEAKEELREVVGMLRLENSERYAAAGATMPRGVLLSGGPGIGKTLLARAVAGEAGLPFFSASGSSFVEIWVGQGAARVRDLFAQARAHAPCVLFIDELDAVGAERGSDNHPERDQTLNQLLVELDGCAAKEHRSTGTGAITWFTKKKKKDNSVLVIAATNRADVLDAALVRPGRFDVRVELGAFDARAREQILRVHADGKTLSPQVDLAGLAGRTRGFSGAALASLLNAAAVIAVRKGRVEVSPGDVEVAFDREVLGLERGGKGTRDAAELNVVALHEAGHAIVAARLLGVGAVHKVSIVARGAFGGVTVLEPPSDLASRDELEKRLAVALGGRAGEERGLGRRGVTVGASSDLEVAAKMARAMVERWGRASGKAAA